jgi:hypothetical protein
MSKRRKKKKFLKETDRVIFKCDKGHVGTALVGDVMANGVGCLECNHPELMLEEVRARTAERDLTLVSDVYVTCHESLEFMVVASCGHTHKLKMSYATYLLEVQGKSSLNVADYCDDFTCYADDAGEEWKNA